MALDTPSAGLGEPTRRLRQIGKSAEKVTLSVAPGDELVVTDDIAAQLQAASGAFVDSDTPRADTAMEGITTAAEAEAARLAELAEIEQFLADEKAERAAAEAAATTPDPTPATTPEPVEPEKPAPAKKSTKKAPAKP